MQSLETGGYTAEEVQDALHKSGRHIKFRYELLDMNLRHLGWIDDLIISGNIKNHQFADIKRQASFHLRHKADINFYTERVRPWLFVRMPDKTERVREQTQLANSSPPLWEWYIEGDGEVYEEDGYEVIHLRNGAYAEAIFPTEEQHWRFRADTFPVGESNWPEAEPGEGSRHWEVYYLDENFQSVVNDAGFANNGHAKSMPADQWNDGWDDDPGWMGTGSGAGVHHIAFYLFGGTNSASPEVKYRRPMLTTGPDNDQEYESRYVYRDVHLDQWVGWPLGVFLLSSPKTGITSSGPASHVIAAYDQLLVLRDHGISDRYSVTQGTNVVEAVKSIITQNGVQKAVIPSKPDVLPTTREWDIGTTILQIVNDLLDSINYGSLSFDSHGRAWATQYQRPDERPTDYTYQTDNRSLILPAADYEYDTFGVANRWIGVVSEPDEPPMVSVYQNDNPLSPTSTVNLGRIITDFRDDIEVVNQAALDEYIERIAFEASQVFERVDLETVLMPMHETGDLLRVTYPELGVAARYVETDWEMDLRIGGTMKHKLRRLVAV